MRTGKDRACRAARRNEYRDNPESLKRGWRMHSDMRIPPKRLELPPVRPNERERIKVSLSDTKMPVAAAA